MSITIHSLVYKIIDSTTACLGTDSDLNANAIGDIGSFNSNIIIPEYIEYEGSKYTVTKIGYRAFRGSELVYSIFIPYSISIIEQQAFDWCSNLYSIIFAEGSRINTIQHSAFNGIGASLFVIPLSVSSIYSYGFGYSPNLHDIYYCGTSEFTELSIFQGSNSDINIHVVHNYPYNTFGGKTVNKTGCSFIENTNLNMCRCTQSKTSTNHIFLTLLTLLLIKF